MQPTEFYTIYDMRYLITERRGSDGFLGAMKWCCMGSACCPLAFTNTERNRMDTPGNTMQRIQLSGGVPRRTTGKCLPRRFRLRKKGLNSSIPFHSTHIFKCRRRGCTCIYLRGFFLLPPLLIPYSGSFFPGRARKEGVNGETSKHDQGKKRAARKQ